VFSVLYHASDSGTTEFLNLQYEKVNYL